MRKSVTGPWALVFAVLVLSAPFVSARLGWWDDLFQEQVTSLEKIIASPESFRGQTVSFTLQFHQIGQISNPFYTKFETDRYLNFAAWPDTAALWDKASYRQDFPYLFAKRTSEAASAILHAPVYSRWLVTGEVSEVFRGQAWIDVTAVKRLDAQLDEPSLVHLVKGFMLRDLRRYDAAADEFRSAEHKNLPATVRTLAMREEALALHNAGKTVAGVARLEQALLVSEDDAQTKGALVMLRESIGLDPNGQPRPGTPAENGGGVPATPAPNETTGGNVPAPAPVEAPVGGGTETPVPAPAPPVGGGTPTPAPAPNEPVGGGTPVPAPTPNEPVGGTTPIPAPSPNTEPTPVGATGEG